VKQAVMLWYNTIPSMKISLRSTEIVKHTTVEKVTVSIIVSQ